MTTLRDSSLVNRGLNASRVWLALLAVTASAACGTPALPPGSPDNGGLVLPDGFEAVVVHDGVGRARHLAVTDQGIVYVKLRAPNPKGLVALRDTTGDGRADQVEVFGDYDDIGDYGTAMRIHDGYLYFTTAGEVYRQKIVPGQLVPTGPGNEVQLILKHNYKANLPSYEHIAKPIAFDDRGHMYVPFGAPGRLVPGRQPPAVLARPGSVSRAGVAGRHLAIRREPPGTDRTGRPPLRHGHSQRRGHDLEPPGRTPLRAATRAR